MRYGYHVSPPLASIPDWLTDHGCGVFQTYLRDKMRLNSEGIPTPEEQEDYLAAIASSDTPIWGMAHSSLIANIASPDPRLRNGSVGAIVKDANLAALLGFAGVCFHVGYEKGHESRLAAHALASRKYAEGAAKLKTGAQLWLENGAEGTELGQTIEELASVLHAALDTGVDPQRVGVVIDTCHLHVAGFDLAPPDGPDRLVAELEKRSLLPFVRAVHLNDARFECGSKRDRHAIPGQGTINVGLRILSNHHALAHLPAILEMSPESAAIGIAWLLGDEGPVSAAAAAAVTAEDPV